MPEPAASQEPPEFEMTLDMNILQHLGLKMYNSLPAVISEYVANAWDAGATRVAIDVPQESVTEDYEITIEDNGFGMSYEDVEEKFLVVGRNRRTDEGTDEIEVDGETRQIIGRKGIGKLAGFGVAGLVRVRTYKDNRFVEFELDFDDMKAEGNQENPAETSTYEPEVVEWGTEGDRESGTIVTLTDLDRDRRPTLRYIKERVARRFAIIDEDFIVEVNGEEVEPSDRGLKRKCEETWEFDEEITDNEGNDYNIHGWIGAQGSPVEDEDQKGVAVMARGKLVQEPTLFSATTRGPGQFYYEYLVGEVHADFVDKRDLDLISTDRSSLAWGKEPASSLQEWIEDKIVYVAGEWKDIQQSETVNQAQQTESYDSRITNLPDEEQEKVNQFIAKNATGREFEPGTRDEFIEKVAQAVQREIFVDFIESMNEVGIDETDRVMELFRRWEVLDALELMQVARGRLETIEKFREIMQSEIQDEAFLHDFISNNPWVLEPRWDYVDDEPELSKALRTDYPSQKVHDDPDDRIGLICLGYGETLNIVEILRPDVTIERSHLESLELYVDDLRTRVQDAERYRGVNGYLIGGEIPGSQERKVDRLEGDGIYARTYNRMQTIAENTFDQFMQVFERRAQDVGDERLVQRVRELQD